jgi:hypothetical protein
MQETEERNNHQGGAFNSAFQDFALSLKWQNQKCIFLHSTQGTWHKLGKVFFFVKKKIGLVQCVVMIEACCGWTTAKLPMWMPHTQEWKVSVAGRQWYYLEGLLRSVKRLASWLVTWDILSSAFRVEEPISECWVSCLPSLICSWCVSLMQVMKSYLGLSSYNTGKRDSETNWCTGGQFCHCVYFCLVPHFSARLISKSVNK